MKTIGLLGITPKTTISYYSELNDIAKEYYGANASADTLIYSINLNEFLEFSEREEEDELLSLLDLPIQSFNKANVDLIIMAANATHKYYDKLVSLTQIPFLHIADSIGQELKDNNIDTVVMIGTKTIISSDFYKERLSKFGVNVITPQSDQDILFIDQVINQELLTGIHNVDSRKRIISIVEQLIEATDAKGVLLASTEFTNFLRSDHFNVPVFDSTLIHTRKAFEFINK